MTRVTVIGLGYIGLPTAAMFATHGVQVHGFDINAAIVERLRRGEIHIEEPGLAAFVRDAVASGRFVPSAELSPADAYIICVPTPHDPVTKAADLGAVESAARALVPILKKGDLIILESTVPARTTEDVVAPILAKSGLDPRRDLHLAHCPETVLPGNMIHELQHNHRIVGGLTPESADAARRLYQIFVRSEILVTDATTAEFVKLIENTYRDVNIALANELAIVARKLGIDVRAAIAVANKHPRVRLHQPGPGVGGHCIPVDPWFIVHQAPEATLIRMAREVNDAMPAYVVDVASRMTQGRDPQRVAVLGLAYKGNVDDVRESPSFEIIRQLRARWPAVEVAVEDPLADAQRYGTVPMDTALRGADLVILVTDHAVYRNLDPAETASLVRERRILDTRGMLDLARWRAEGFHVERI